MKLYDDIKSENTVGIFADYSKAFYSIDLNTLLMQKIHSFNFSKDFLYWAMNYQMFQQHFAQIDAHFSSLSTSEFGVQQDCILGPILFKLCLADISQITPESECLQYAYDTTLYRACKTSQRHACINSIEKDIQSILRVQKRTFKSPKTNTMALSTPQMSKHHELKEEKYKMQYSSRKNSRIEIPWNYTWRTYSTS